MLLVQWTFKVMTVLNKWRLQPVQEVPAALAHPCSWDCHLGAWQLAWTYNGCRTHRQMIMICIQNTCGRFPALSLSWEIPKSWSADLFLILCCCPLLQRSFCFPSLLPETHFYIHFLFIQYPFILHFFSPCFNTYIFLALRSYLLAE